MSVRNSYIINNAVDAKWFLELKSINRPLLLQSLEIDSQNQVSEKERFFSDNNYNPTFKYRNLNVQASSAARERLLKLRELVWQNEPDSSIRDLYFEKLTELIDEQSLLCAAAENNPVAFIEANIKRYGNLNQELVRRDKVALLQTDVSLLKEVITKSFANWPTLSPSSGLYNAEQIKESWQAALHDVSPDWSVEISDVVLHLRVSNKRRKVYVPAHMRVDGVRLAALFDHEVGTHVFRRERGKVFPVQLFSIGTAGYELAEEGIALIREYASRGKFGLYGGQDKYLALSYALGDIDGVPHDFRETYMYLRERYFQRHSKKHSKEQAERLADERAWLGTVRIFRGGDTSVPGCCFYRDKLYREGVYYMLNALKNASSGMQFAATGKFDPTNENQLLIVQKFAEVG